MEGLGFSSFSVQSDRIGKAAVGVLLRARSCHGCQALVVCKSTPPPADFVVVVVHASLACSGRIAVRGDWQDHQVHCIARRFRVMLSSSVITRSSPLPRTTLV